MIRQGLIVSQEWYPACQYFFTRASRLNYFNDRNVSINNAFDKLKLVNNVLINNKYIRRALEKDKITYILMGFTMLLKLFT